MTPDRKRRFHFLLEVEKVKKLKMLNSVHEISSSSNLVAMPWDDKREIVVTMGGITKTCTKWELIQSQIDLSNPINNCCELINVIKSYNVLFDRSGNQTTLPWKCLVLQKYFANLDSNELRNFFCENGILSTIRNLVLKLKEMVPSLKLLRSGTSGTIKLHQMQVASLLANAFMCTFPKGKSSCPSINFNTLFEGSTNSVAGYNVEKIKCLINYFARIHRKQPSGHISFHRLFIPDHKFPRWDKTDVKLSSLNVNASEKIEDQIGYVHVDFANKYVGGGVLGRGCVQEEIRFITCPELIVSRLFTESLLDNEALLVVGTERFCKYSGYSNTFKYAGDYQDATPFDESGHRKSYLAVVDALCFHHFPEQFRESKILRELKKAYVGFKPWPGEPKNPLPLATGNWGCGAFGGDPQLKSLLQLMASSQAGRNVLYLTFGDTVLKKQLEQLYELLRDKSVNVGMLYRIVRLYHRERKHKQTVFEFIREALLKMEKHKSYSSLQSLSSSKDDAAKSLSSSATAMGRQVFKDEENLKKYDLLEGESSDACFPYMDIDFEALDEEVRSCTATVPVAPSQQEFATDSVSPNASDTTVWFESETGSQRKNRERRLTETKESDVVGRSCSPSMFSDDDVEVREKSLDTQVSYPSQKASADNKESAGSAEGKKLVQKKITDCFLKK